MIHITACRTDNDDVSDFETVKAADPLPNHEVGCFHNFLPHVGKQAFVGAEISDAVSVAFAAILWPFAAAGSSFVFLPQRKTVVIGLSFKINKFPQKMRLADELE